MSAIEEDLKDEVLKESEEHKTDLANTCELLLNEKFRKRKTRLRQRSTSALSTIETIANLYDITFLKEWVNNYTEYVTSIDGKGRQEIVDIAKYSIDKQKDMNMEILQSLGRR